MNRRVARLLFLIGLSAAFVAGRVVTPAAAEPPVSGPVADTVLAQRYRVPMADTAMEWAHGAWVWVEELYLPDRGLVANVRWDYAWKADPTDPAKGEFTTIPRMTAFASPKPRNQYRDFVDAKIGRESPIEEIRIPKALADEITSLADMARRVDDAKSRLGARASDGTWIRRFNHDGAGIPADPSAVPPPLPAMK